VITQADLMNVDSDPFGKAIDDVEKFTELEVTLGEFKGWYYNLSASGEKSLAASTVIGGVAYFTSFSPATATANQCSLTGGSGGLYAFHLHYGTKVYDSLKFTTSNDVPDTPQLYFGVGDSCVDGNSDGFCDDNTSEKVREQSQFLSIGPGVKGAQNPFKVQEILGPGLTIENGKIKLVSDKVPIGFGFKTQQMYIYKQEKLDLTY